MTSPTWTAAGSCPRATTLTVMSRSVRMPLGFPLLVTTSAPTFLVRISRAASSTVVSAWTVTTGLVQTSPIIVHLLKEIRVHFLDRATQMPFRLIEKLKEFHAPGSLPSCEDRGIRASGGASGVPPGGTSSQRSVLSSQSDKRSPSLILLSADG